MKVIPTAGYTPPEPAWNVEAVRRDFPVLSQQVYGVPLAYLDNAATAQKPQAVIDALTHYYTHDGANVHRAVHTLAARATAAYEAAREQVREFLHARSSHEIVFVRGTTEAINLVANSLGNRFALAMKSYSPPWSITPTSCPGSCCANATGSCCVCCPLHHGVNSCWRNSKRFSTNARGWWP